MSAFSEEMLASRFAALAPEPLEGDWLDVQRRARRGGRRRTFTLLIAAAFAVLVVGSALAFGPRIIDFFSAEPAPTRVVGKLEEGRRFARFKFGKDTRVIADQARTIFDLARPDGSSVYLAVAPMGGGGFCMYVSTHGPDGQPQTEGGGPCLSLQELARSRRDGNEIYSGGTSTTGTNGIESGYGDFLGFVAARGTDHLVLRYEDGTEDRIPVTWVSKPIDAGFFAFNPPADKRAPGHRALAFVAVDANGKELARQKLTYVNRNTPAPPSWSTVALVNKLTDMDLTVYERPIRIDDPQAVGAGVKAPFEWVEYVYRLERNDTYTMTPWAGVYELAFAPVGEPVSRAVVRGRIEVTPGARLVVAAGGVPEHGQTRMIVKDSRTGTAPLGKALVRVWNLLPGSTPLRVEVARAVAPYNSCRAPSTGWVTIATGLRFGEVTQLTPFAPDVYHVRVSADGKRVADGFLEAPHPQDAQPGEPPNVGESFIGGIATSTGVKPTIWQVQYGVEYPSKC